MSATAGALRRDTLAELDLEALVSRLSRVERELEAYRSTRAAGSTGVPAGIDMSDPLVRSVSTIQRHPRSSFEGTGLAHFNNQEVLSVRKHFNGDPTKPLTRRPEMRLTPKVQDLFRFLYKFRGANYGVIAQAGIWSNRDKQGGLAGVITKMKLLDAAGYIDRTRYPHPLLAEDGRATRYPERDWRHVTLTTKAINILRQEGVITTGTNPSEIKKRLRGNRVEWPHQNYSTEAALTLVNQTTDSSLTYEIHKSEREHRIEQRHARGERAFRSYGGSTVNPDVTVIKTDLATGKRTFLMLEYDHGFYARSGRILDRKLEMISAVAGTDEEDIGASVEDYGSYGDDERPTGAPHQPYWSEQARGFDDVKLVFVAYSETVKNEEMRYIGASYAGDDPAQLRRRAFVERYCEFVTFAQLKRGEIV